MTDLEFDRHFEPAYGEAVPVADGVARITVNNPGPFTFHGTNSYIVGNETLAVIDPGPEDDAHFRALIAAIGERPVSYIFVSHTHADHSPLAARLKRATGATIVAEGPHRAARPLHIGEVNPLDASSDTAFRPDVRLRDGDVIDVGEWAIEAIATPGHTANHMAFGLKNSGLMFSADHVMAWATSIVAPPDGAMADYMASLERLAGRDEAFYLPGHGGPVAHPGKFVRALRTHRKMREAAVLDRIRKGDRTIADMVREIYRDTDPRLHGAAALSVLAHLEDLVARGLVQTDGPPSIDGIYVPA